MLFFQPWAGWTFRDGVIAVAVLVSAGRLGMSASGLVVCGGCGFALAWLAGWILHAGAAGGRSFWGQVVAADLCTLRLSIRR